MAEQNEIAGSYSESGDLAARENSILKEISKATKFVPTKLLGRSSFWASDKIGAFHYKGHYKDKEAVLKVQGIKPTTSEIYMLQSFEQKNHSDIIRPPHLYTSLPWKDDKGYEALIMEDVKGEKVVNTPSTESEIKRFFELYEEYRTNCLQEPWINKPVGSISGKILQNFEKWKKSSQEVYPNHPHRKEEDFQIIEKAMAVLASGYKNIEPQFEHGHFSADDLYKVEDKIVLLSNLYWSWRAPLYDAVFAYHWYIYRLANAVDNLTLEDIETHKSLWLKHIHGLPETQSENKKLLDLALLERETAGLLTDALTVNPNKPISSYVMESTRKRVEELSEQLSV